MEREKSLPADGMIPVQPAAVPGYAWVILGVVFLASVAAPLNQNKVPPLIPVLIETFQITLGQAGMLMSVFAITGLVLALPAGIILQRLGPRMTGLIALGGLAAGAALGAVSNDVNLLMFSRVVEGIGMGLIAVVAPAVIAAWFPSAAQGTAMGLWATWVPVGTLIMYNLAPLLAATYSWRAVWWFGAGFTLVVMVLYLLLVRLPDESGIAGETPGQAVGEVSLAKALANRDIWLLAAAFACFNIVLLSLASFYPAFLTEAHGYSLSQAAFISSISTFVILFAAPAAGWISDRFGSRRLVIALPFLFVAVMMLLPFRVAGWQIPALMVLLGLVVGAIPTATFAAAPEVMGSPRLAGLGLAVIMLGQNLGMFVGPVLFGQLVESLGWFAAGAWMVPVALLGFLAAWKVRVR